MATNIYDLIVKHRVNLEKLKNQISKRAIKTFLSSYPELKPLFLGFESFNEKQVRELMKEINNILTVVNNDLMGDISKDSIAIAKYENKFQKLLIAKLTDNAVKPHTLSNELIENIVFNRFTEGELFEKTFSRMNNDFRSQIERSIRMSIINGETGIQASNRIKNSYNLKRSQLDSLSRTLIQNAVNQADEETYKTSVLIEKVRYNAILDSRTTKICHDLNGKIFNVGEGPRPPQHFNCRSFTTVVFDEDEDLIPKTYDAWYNKQESKTGLKSLDKERFVTDETLTLTQLEKESNKLLNE